MTYKTTIRSPIKSAADADSFTRALAAAGKLFHYEDDPADFGIFDDDELPFIVARLAEIEALPDYDPFELIVELEQE